MIKRLGLLIGLLFAAPAAASDWYVSPYSPFKANTIEGTQCRYLRIEASDSGYTPALATNKISKAKFQHDFNLKTSGVGASVTLKTCSHPTNTGTCSDFQADLDGNNTLETAALSSDITFYAATPAQYLRALITTQATAPAVTNVVVCGWHGNVPNSEIDPFFKAMDTETELETQLGGLNVWTENDGPLGGGGGGSTPTDIAQGTRTSTTVPITSSTGTDATLTEATTTLAGVMTAADKTKLDNVGTNNYVTNAMMSDDSIGIAELSATGTPDSTTFLRGDNTWAVVTGGHGDGTNCSAGNYPLGVDANGNVQSCTADDDIPESGDFGAALGLDADGSISVGAVSIASIGATGTPSGSTFLRGDGTWATPAGGGGGIASVFDDPDPTLSADLDANDKGITGLNNIGARNFYADSLAEFVEAEGLCNQDMGGASPTGCHIWYTAPSMTITSSIEVAGTGSESTGNNSLHIHGMGGSLTGNNINDAGTAIHWNNATGDAMMKIGACVGCSVSGFLFDGNSQATAGIKAQNDVLPLVDLEIHHNGFYGINGYAIETQDGGTTDGQGQFDTSWFHDNTIRHSLGCYKQNNSQSLGNIWGPSNTCTWMDGTGPFFDIAYGGFVYRDNYMSIRTDNAKGIRLGAGANNINIQGTNQIEMHSTAGDGISPANASVDGAVAIECEAGANVQDGKVIVDGVQFIYDSGTNKAISCEKRGSVQWTNNNAVNTGAVDNAAVLTAEVSRDDGFATNYLSVTEFNNTKKIPRSSYSGIDLPEAWPVIYSNDPDVMRPSVAAANAPLKCSLGEIWIDTGNGNLSTCYPANTWVSGGDIKKVGTDCTSGDCFVSGGSGTTLQSDGNFIFQADANNNGTNTFQFKSGTGAANIIISELGQIDTVGAINSNSTISSGDQGSTIGTLQLYGGTTFDVPYIVKAPATGATPLTINLPSDTPAVGEVLKVASGTTNAVLEWATDNTGGGGANSFETQNVLAGTDPVADSATDTLNWTVGTGITLTGNSGTDTIDITLAAGLVDLADGTLSGSAVQAFGTSNAGAVGASGGGTTNFLRADGTWAAPPGGGATDLTSLTDVTLTSPATGSVLIKSAGDWIDGAVDLADTDAVTGTLPAASVGTGLTDAQVSDTLTASLFVGSGSTTTAIDLATAEAAGVLTNAKGGTGDDTSAVTGVAQVTSGNWTYDAGLGDLADDLGCTGSQTVRRNSGDTAFECFTASVGGDVSKVGTPVNNQVGVWTGDGTIEGDTALTFDTTTDTLATGTITTADPGDGSRRSTFKNNTTSVDAPSAGECNLGFVGTVLYKHCNGESQAAIDTAGSGDNVNVNGSSTVDPNFTSTGSEITLTNTSNVITFTINDGVTVSGWFGDTAAVNDNDTSLATTAFVQAETAAAGEIAGTLGGGFTINDTVTVTGWTMGASVATTPAVDDSDTSLATTLFVQNETVASGDVTGTLGTGFQIASGAVGSTEAAALDAGDITTGTFADTLVDGSLEENEIDLVDLADSANACSASQIVRRNAGDTGFECATAGGGFTSFSITGDDGAPAVGITDGNTLAVTGAGGITVEDGDAGADTLSITYSPSSAEAGNEGVIDLADLQGVLTVAKGGTGASPTADDTVLVSSAADTAAWKALPDSDAATQKLQYDQATNTFSAGTDDDVPDAGDFTNLSTAGGLTQSPAGTITTSMNTARLIGRTSASVGVMEELTVGAGLTLATGALGRAAFSGDVTASADSNDLQIAANAVGITEHADDSVGINELDLIDTPTALADGNCLAYSTAAGGSIDVKSCGGGSSPWQTTSNVANLVTAGDAVTVGSATALAKLAVDGDTDAEIGFLVQGSATQSVDLMVAENSSGTDQWKVSAAGATTQVGTATVGTLSDPADAGAIRLDNATSIAWESAPASGNDVTITVDSSELVQIANGFLDGLDISAGSITGDSMNSNVAGRSLTLNTSTTPDQIDADAELYTRTYSATVKAPASTDDFMIAKANGAITVTAINCLVDPADTGESVVLTVNEYDGNGDTAAGIDGATTITCGNTNTADDGALSNSAVDSGDWIGVDLGTVTGTVSFMSITITYTVND